MEKFELLIRKSSFWVIFKNIVSGALGIAVTTYVVRTISVHDFGIYNILFALLGYVGILSSFGLINIYQRFIPELHVQEKYYVLKRLVSAGALVRLVVSAIFVALIIQFSDEIGSLLNIENALSYIQVFGIGIILYLEMNLLNIALMALFLHKYVAISNIIYTVMRGIIIFVFLQKGFGLNGIIIAEVIAWALLIAVLILFYYYKFFLLTLNPKKEEFPVGRFVKYGKFAYFNEMGASILNVSTDLFIISAFLGPAAVGIYAFATKIEEMFSRYMPHKALKEVIRPAFVRKFAQTGGSDSLEKMFNLLVKFGAFFIFPFTIGILVLGDKLILYVFGEKYIGSLPILWIVVLFSALNVVITSTGMVLQAIEKVEILFYSKIFAIYNLVGDLIVVKPYGVIGVALVTGSAVVMKNIFCFYYAKKYTGISIDIRGLRVIMLNSMLMGGVFLLSKPFVVDIYSFILVLVIGGTLYLTFAYLNKAFSSEEQAFIGKITKRPVFVF